MYIIVKSLWDSFSANGKEVTHEALRSRGRNIIMRLVHVVLLMIMQADQ
jgi:hypothetical protein